MCCDWDGDEEGFEGERLVVGSGEEEVGFRGWDGARYEGYYGGVGYVESGVDSEDVGGVALEACDCRFVSYSM